MSDGKGHDDDSRGIMKCWDRHSWCGSVSSPASSPLSFITLFWRRVFVMRRRRWPSPSSLSPLALIKLLGAAQRMPVPFLRPFLDLHVLGEKAGRRASEVGRCGCQHLMAG
ncbi:hypothetical protein BHE74_00040625 [Ensete ventricosum]|nr:hypothetical protein GW17_00008769 [Ensete ventricosum]RWW52922.1 hypothetical protein BHE74_00040625 [Ensete ventricosum]RZS09366.1 hypothetical protein BHM03_00040435 [Ensete ventricosum]